jgi:AcrR family transcriptional regulator
MSVLRPEFPDHSSPFSRDQERRRKRDAIVSAAAKRFNEHGFVHTRLEDVAADLGLTKTSISYYFSNKDELAEAVFRTAADFLKQAVDQALATKGDAAGRIEALFSVYGRQLVEAASGQRPHLAALRDLAALPDAVRHQITEEVSACVAQINGWVEDWIGQTGAPISRPEPVTFMILALLDWMGELQTRRRRGDDARGEHDALIDLISHGLAADPGVNSDPAPLDLTSEEALAIFDRDTRNRMKREAFLKAGSRLFNQKGFGGVSLGEVAASLGVSRGAFYYHIEDKEQFLDQCLERSLHIVERALQQAEEAELAPLTRVHSVLAELVYRQAAGVEPLLRPTMAAVLPLPRQRRHRTRLQNIARRLGDALTEGAAAGDVRSVDTSFVEDILASVVFLNGGYALAAADSFSGWSIAEDPPRNDAGLPLSAAPRP